MTMLCTLIRGQMSYTFFQLGAHVLLCQLLGGQMSSYAIFHRGAHVRGGGGGNVLHSENIHDKSLNSKDMAIIFPLFLFFNIGKKT